MAGAPYLVGGTLTPFFSNSSVASMAVPKPAGLIDGDLMVIAIRTQGTLTGSEFSPLPSGWTRGGTSGAQSGDRGQGIFYKIVTSASSEPASYTFGGWGSGRVDGGIGIIRNYNPAGVNVAGIRFDADQTMPSMTPTSAPFLAFWFVGGEFTAGQSHVPNTPPSPWGTAFNHQSSNDNSTSGSRTGSWLGQIIGADGASTSIAGATLTWPATPVNPKTNTWALLGYPTKAGTASGGFAWAGSAVGENPGANTAAGAFTWGGSATGDAPSGFGSASGAFAWAGSASGAAPWIPGFPDIDHMLATPGATIAHRGGSQNYPEFSRYAYVKAVQRGFGALEFSCSVSSDGVFFGLADRYLDRTALNNPSGTTLNPRTMTWAAISAYNIVIGASGAPQPYYRLDEFLDEFAQDYVVCIDPKYGVESASEVDAMLAVIDAHVPNKADHVVIKFDSPGGVFIATKAHAAGLLAMNYWGTDSTSLASQQSNWDWLGVLYTNTANFGTWTAYGKPVWAAVIPSQAGYDAAIAAGADIAMISNIVAVAPVGFSASPAVGAGAGAFAWAGSASGERTPEASASGAFAWAGTSAGERTSAGVVSGAFTWAGSAAGEREAGGSATGATTWAGAASGETDHAGTAAGGFNWIGSATSGSARTGMALGAFMWAGAAEGETDYSGSAVGGFTWAGSAVGARESSGTSTGAYLWVGEAEGDSPSVGTAEGVFTWDGSATGTSATWGGTASGVFTWVGSASGAAPADFCWPSRLSLAVDTPGATLIADQDTLVLVAVQRSISLAAEQHSLVLLEGECL